MKIIDTLGKDTNVFVIYHKGEMLEEPQVELPDDMQFNETGQKLGDGSDD